MFKRTNLDFFDLFKKIAEKLFIQFEFNSLKTRIQQKMVQTHQTIINFFNFNKINIFKELNSLNNNFSHKLKKKKLLI